VSSTDYKALRYVVFSTPLLPRPLSPKYLPQHPILKHPQPMQHHSNVPGQSFESSVLSKLCVSLCSVIMVKVLVYISDVSHVKPSAYIPPSTWNQVSHPYEATGKVIVLYILILILLGSKPKDKRFCAEWQAARNAW